MNEQTTATWLAGEHDQTIAAILTRMKPAVAARILPLLGDERMEEISARMITLGTLPRAVVEQLEDVITKDFLSAATRKSTIDPHARMADLFNKMEGPVFDKLADGLSKRIPDALEEIRKKMFTFDDMVRLDAGALQRIMRAAPTTPTNTLALALRGAKPEVREAFMQALTERARKMLESELKDMGEVRLRETREAQSALIDIANQLARQEVIRLPSEEDEMI